MLKARRAFLFEQQLYDSTPQKLGADLFYASYAPSIKWLCFVSIYMPTPLLSDSHRNHAQGEARPRDAARSGSGPGPDRVPPVAGD